MTKEELIVANIELRETLLALRGLIDDALSLGEPDEETVEDDGEEDQG
jgi:hypothetical protein